MSILEEISRASGYKRFMRLVLWMSLGLIVTGLFLLWRNMVHYTPLLVTGMSSLAIWSLVYVSTIPYQPVGNDVSTERGLQTMWRLIMVLTGYLLACLLEGGLFMLMHWPGGAIMLITSASGLVLVGLVALLYFHKRSQLAVKKRESLAQDL